jgi:hypothetical protein
MSEYICQTCSKKYKFKTSFEKHVRDCSKPPVKEPVKEPSKPHIKEEQKEPTKERVKEPVKVEQKQIEKETVKETIKEPLPEIKVEQKEPEVKRDEVKQVEPNVKLEHLEHIAREECNCVHCDKRFVTIDILKFIQELENKNFRIQELEQCVDKLYQKLVECRKAYVHLFDLYDEKLNKHNYEDDD